MKFKITEVTLLILTICFYSCSNSKKDEIVPEVPTEYVDEQKIYEEIYKSSGCKVKDAKSIFYFRKTVDTISNEMYLYGSRKKENKEIFWVSKYKPDGDLLWDTTYSLGNNHESTALFFNTLSDNTAAVIYITDRNSVLTGKNITETKLIVLNTLEGKISKSIDFGSTNYYTIKPLINTFLLYNTDIEIAMSPRAGLDVFVYNNQGNRIEYPSNSIRVPRQNDLIINDTLFISNTPISIVNLFGQQKWRSNNPKTKLINYSIKDDILNLQYEIDGQKDIVQYNLKTNKLISDSSVDPGSGNITYADVNKQYKASDNLDVVVHNIEVSDNSKGTKYYKIRYSLYNNTENEKVTEGTFKLVNENGSQIQQYGFFSSIFPGESVTNRSYEFKELSNEKMIYIQYQPSTNTSSSNKITLRWKIPSE